MKSRMMPLLQPPVQRVKAGKLPSGATGSNPSITDTFGLPFHTEAESVSPSIIGFGLPFAEDGAIAASFIIPPLPFAQDGAE